MYCNTCGTKLIMKRDGIDGFVPFCMNCQTFKYPTFSDAISSVIFSPDKKEILLIQQYGRKDNVLVAGYVTKGENLETTLKREIEEEVHLEIERFMYNDNQYYERTNTLITNFMAVAKDNLKHHQYIKHNFHFGYFYHSQDKKIIWLYLNKYFSKINLWKNNLNRYI